MRTRRRSSQNSRNKHGNTKQKESTQGTGFSKKDMRRLKEKKKCKKWSNTSTLSPASQEQEKKEALGAGNEGLQGKICVHCQFRPKWELISATIGYALNVTSQASHPSGCGRRDRFKRSGEKI